MKSAATSAGCLLAGAIAVVGSCSPESTVDPGGSRGGQAGDSARGGATSGKGGRAVGGRAGIGGSGTSGRGGLTGRGGGAATGGTGGEAGSSLCIDEYELPNYTGSTDGLCPARESAEWFCCEEDGHDVTGAVLIICAPDKSFCYVDWGFCTRLESIDVCGWKDCGDPGWSPGLGGFGGEGGSPFAGCPEDLRCDWDGNCNDYVDSTTIPCASDAHCGAGRACNRRVGNRMFCGDAE